MASVSFHAALPLALALSLFSTTCAPSSVSSFAPRLAADPLPATREAVRKINSTASAFEKAVLADDASTVRMLLQEKRDLMFGTLLNEDGDRSPIVEIAVVLGCTGVLRVICDIATEEEFTSGRIGRPLHCAAAIGDLQAVRLLIDSGKATPQIQNGGRALTPLMYAASADHPGIVSLLLQHGFDPTARSMLGRAAWSYARPWTQDGAACLRLLMPVTPPAFRKESNGWNHLHAVADLSQEQLEATVATLIELNAFRPEERWVDHGGTQIPLLMLVNPKLRVPMESDSSRLAKAETLLKHGADVDVRDDLGRTALHWASMRNDTESMKLLLRYGAAVDVVASERLSRGETPIALAVMTRATDAIVLLLERKADVDLYAGGGNCNARDLAERDCQGIDGKHSLFTILRTPFPLTAEAKVAIEKVRSAPAGSSAGFRK